MFNNLCSRRGPFDYFAIPFTTYLLYGGFVKTSEPSRSSDKIHNLFSTVKQDMLAFICIYFNASSINMRLVYWHIMQFVLC